MCVQAKMVNAPPRRDRSSISTVTSSTSIAMSCYAGLMLIAVYIIAISFAILASTLFKATYLDDEKHMVFNVGTHAEH